MVAGTENLALRGTTSGGGSLRAAGAAHHEALAAQSAPVHYQVRYCPTARSLYFLP
nr:unnamed protein product [Callosobruchus analis]